MNPREVLSETLADVKEADTPDDLRAIAFSKVFDLRAGLVVAHAPAPAAQSPVPASGGATNTSAEGVDNDLLSAIAAKIGSDRGTVGEVFDVRNGELELIIGAGKLPAQVAAGAKEIALLVAGSRQAAGIEEWTSLDTVREVCAEFKKLDSGNFSKTIRSMTDEFNVRKESERKSVVRVSRPGWESFAAMVKRLAGAS